MTADFARRVMWWSLLITTPAGVSYSAKDVADWATTKVHAAEQPWRQALALPGAGAIAPMAAFFDPMEFWRLKPLAGAVIGQTGGPSLRGFMAASGIAGGNRIVVYVPEARVVALVSGTWPAAAEAKWFSPRTGLSSPAVAVASSSAALKFTTPGAGDWVLLIHAKR